jgi:hypothetical protein
MSKGPDPDSLVTRVVAAVRKRGTATLDDLQAIFPDTTRDALRSTITRAVSRGLLCGVVKPTHNRPAVYGALKEASPEVQRIARVSSVWGLASEPVPILSLPGRLCSPLGPWRDAE